MTQRHALPGIKRSERNASPAKRRDGARFYGPPIVRATCDACGRTSNIRIADDIAAHALTCPACFSRVTR